jgi:hypothetical protein
MVVAVILVLWYYGFLAEFFKPWKGWADYIGYFQ